MERTILHIETPTIESTPLTTRTGTSTYLKMECFQPAGSFKIRGIGLLCRRFVQKGISHLVSSSGGNAGFAVAYAGKRLGCKVTVIVPETTSDIARERIASEGATVRVFGSVWDESHAYALDLCDKIDAAYIPPFDHPTIWEGHSTIIDEMARQCPKPDAIVLAVGGGGLLCGVAEGLEKRGWHDVSIIAVETEGAASFARSVEAGTLITLESIDTIATSLGAKRVTAKALELVQSHPIIPVTVTDHAAIRACRRFADDHRVLVEPACGAALSAVYDPARAIREADTIAVIICGGIGISIDSLHMWEGELLA